MRFALTVLFTSCFLASLAQVEDELTLNFDLGYQRALRLDPYQSDIRQNGHWLVGSGGFTDISGPWMNYLEGGGHGGFSSSAIEGDYSIRDYGGEVYYELLYNFWNPKWGGALFSGLSSLTDISYTQNTRLGNNEWSFRVASSFGVGATYLYPFEWKKQKFRASFRQHIPLVVFGTAPTYTVAIVADEEDWKEWTFLGGNQLWRSQYEFEWQQDNGNSFGIRYIWSYGRLDSPNRQYWAFHEFGLVMHVAL